MAQFQYATKKGTLATIDAADQAAALTAIRGLADADPNSGVMAVPAAQAPAAAAPIPGENVNRNYNYGPDAPATSPLTSPAPAPQSIQTPQLPTPTAPAVQQSFVTSAVEQAANARAALDSGYKRQLDIVTKHKQDSEARIKELEGKQQDVLTNDIQPLLQPFRENLENTERERLYINKNFEDNQKLIDELDSLLTEGNAIIKEKQAFGGVSFVRDARVSKTIEDISARAGVIQAVMSARSGQIAEAERLIDRSVEAITADRKDRLAFFNAIDAYYKDQKDEEGKKLIDLTEEERTYIGAQISLLEDDLKRANETSDAIKTAMLDPDLAAVYGQAGVTLNDTPEQIQQKLATYAYQKEVRDISNAMAADGYSYVAPGQNPPTGARLVSIIDSKGNERRYYAPAATTGAAAGSATAPQSAPTGDDGQPLQYGTPEYVIERLRNTAGSKTKPVASEREQLGKFRNVVALTDSLMGSLNNTTTDPVIGYLKSLNPYDFDARAVNAQVTALVPSVARGLYGEVGVLTDSDIERYLQTLPNIRSTDDQNKFIALLTLKNAMRSYEETLLNLANSGVNVSGFEDSYKALSDTVSGIEADLKVSDAVLTAEDEAALDEVLGQASEGNYFSRLWNALWGR